MTERRRWTFERDGELFIPILLIDDPATGTDLRGHLRAPELASFEDLLSWVSEELDLGIDTLVRPDAET